VSTCFRFWSLAPAGGGFERLLLLLSNALGFWVLKLTPFFFVFRLVDIAFLMSNHFKKERRGGSAAASTEDGAHLESSTVGGLYHELSRPGLGV